MSSIDQQFVEYIVKSLVGNPDAVSINRTIDEKGVLLELTVDPEDLGRVIGKRGGTAQSLRTLLRALGTKNDARYNLKIVDNSPEGERRPRREDSAVPAADSNQAQDDPAVAVDDTSGTPLEDNEDTVVADEESSVVHQTRKELEELDDLDV